MGESVQPRPPQRPARTLFHGSATDSRKETSERPPKVQISIGHHPYLSVGCPSQCNSSSDVAPIRSRLERQVSGDSSNQRGLDIGLCRRYPDSTSFPLFGSNENANRYKPIRCGSSYIAAAPLIASGGPSAAVTSFSAVSSPSNLPDQWALARFASLSEMPSLAHLVSHPGPEDSRNTENSSRGLKVASRRRKASPDQICCT